MRKAHPWRSLACLKSWPDNPAFGCSALGPTSSYLISHLSELWSSRSPQAELTNTQAEIVKGMSVDAIQFTHQGNSILHHNPNVSVLPFPVLGKSQHIVMIKLQHGRLCQAAIPKQYWQWSGVFIRMRSLILLTAELQNFKTPLNSTGTAMRQQVWYD